MIKKVLIAVGAAAVAALGGSLIHPFGTTTAFRANRVILQKTQIDPETLTLVQRGCQNCHSQNTEWPWYSHVAPVSWLLARDVQQARSHMNLSQWQNYSTDDRLRLLSAIGSTVRNHAMPPQRYLVLHPEARLSDGERQQIYRWTRIERRRAGIGQTSITSASSHFVFSKQPESALLKLPWGKAFPLRVSLGASSEGPPGRVRAEAQ